MLSLKDTLRKLIVTATLAAVTTHFFTGCSNNQVTSSDLYAPSLTAEVEAPPLTYEAPNPGITESDSDSFSIKYKYWYDNPEVKEAQEQSLAESNPTPGALTDKNFLNLNSLPIYRDSGGNEYIISGRTKVYLSNGKIASKDLYNLLRDSEGHRIYYGLWQSISELLNQFTTALAGATQPATYEERVQVDTLPHLEAKEYNIYVNNINTNTTMPADGMICISSLLPSYGLANFVGDGEEGPVFYLYTAAESCIKLTFSSHDNKVDIEYSTGETARDINATQIIVSQYELSMTAQAIEKYLGYDVEVYDDFINIVTDNKDIITEGCEIPSDASSLAVGEWNVIDTTKPIEPQLPNQPDNEQPAATTPTTDTSNPSEATPPEDSSNSINPDKPDESGTSLADTPSAPSDADTAKPITSKPDLSDHEKTPGGAYIVSSQEWDYFEEHPEEIPNGGIEYNGGGLLNPEEAAKWNQKIQDNWDGKTEHHLGENMTPEEDEEFLQGW